VDRPPNFISDLLGSKVEFIALLEVHPKSRFNAQPLLQA
jgi:hypothetical protein